MRRNSIPMTLTLAASSLALAACGSGSSSTPTMNADQTAAAAKVKAAFQTATDRGAFPFAFDANGVTCVANTVVQQLGVAKVEQYGFDKRAWDQGKLTMSEADAKIVSGAVLDCAPNGAGIKYFVDKLNSGMGSAVTPTQQACVDQALTRGALVDLLASEFDGQSVAGQNALSAVVKAQAKTCGIGSKS